MLCLSDIVEVFNFKYKRALSLLWTLRHLIHPKRFLFYQIKQNFKQHLCPDIQYKQIL